MSLRDATTVDLLVTNGTLLTMNPTREIIENGALAVGGDKVVAVGSTTELRRRWPAVRDLDARGGLVTPGLVNAHQHVTGGPLIWGAIPDTLPPGASIFEWAVPVHAAERPEDEQIGAAFVGSAGLRNGVPPLVEPGT